MASAQMGGRGIRNLLVSPERWPLSLNAGVRGGYIFTGMSLLGKLVLQRLLNLGYLVQSVEDAIILALSFTEPKSWYRPLL